MNVVARLRSFYRRRIAIPVGRDALVLDVGSGDKPHWRADVLLDGHVGADHGEQRSGSATVRVDRPLFDADAADMPFADHAFDYVICSHVLEHVEHPEAVIAELVRVARAGYIEVPEAASAKIVDFPSHLWWVTFEGGQLVFTAKTTPYFDADIDRYLTSSGLRPAVADLLDRHLDARVIELPWRGEVPHRVVGTPSAQVLGHRAVDVQHRSGETALARVLTTVLTVPRRITRRRRTLHFDDIVRPELRRGQSELLRAQVYTLR